MTTEQVKLHFSKLQGYFGKDYGKLQALFKYI